MRGRWRTTGRRAALVWMVVVSGVVSAPGAVGAADASPAVADPIGEGKVCEDAPSSPFVDTSEEAAGTAAAIGCLAAAGITSGTTATTYSPGAEVTRRQMALFVKRLADLLDALDVGEEVEALPEYDGEPDFSDVVDEDPEFREAIGQLRQAGIVEGVADGRFDPDGSVTRRQMAAFLNRLQQHLVGEPFASESDHFEDDDGDPGEGDLDALASVGIFQGNGDGRVVPGGDISRRQMANVLLRHAQVLFARDVVVAPFVPPAAPQQPRAGARGTTVIVDYVRPAQNPPSTTYHLESVLVDVGEDGTCTTEDDGVPTTGFTEVEGTTERSRGEGTWEITADEVERGCYRFRVVAQGPLGAAAASPVTSPATWVSSAMDGTPPTSLEAFVTEASEAEGVLDAGDVITIAFDEYVHLADAPSITVTDTDGTAAEITADVASFSLNATSVEVGGTAHAPSRVLTVTLLEDLEPTLPGLAADVQVPARMTGASGITDAAGNAWSPSPLGGGDTELEAAT